MYGMGWQRQINPHYIPLNERQVKTVVKKAQEQKIMERRKEEGGRRKEEGGRCSRRCHGRCPGTLLRGLKL